MRMKKEYPIIQATLRGMNCDNPECDWIDPTVEQKDYYKYIDMPCPCCGENLMTKECYEQSIGTINTLEKINKFLNILLPERYKEKLVESKENKIYLRGNVDEKGHVYNLTGALEEYDYE